MLANYHDPSALQIALSRYVEGNFVEADEICQQLLANDASQAAVWSLLGAIALRTSALNAAVQRFERAAVLEPRQAIYQLNLGEAYRRVGAIVPALTHLKQATSLNPTLAEAHYNLGLAYLEAEQSSDAVLALTRAIALKPRIDEDAVLGDALRQTSELQRAKIYYESAISLAEPTAALHAGLGAVLFDSGRLPAAIRQYQRAIDLDPRFGLAQVNLALALKAVGRPNEGLAYLESGLQLEPKHPLAQSNYGSALLELGRCSEAVEALRRAIELNPSAAHVHSNLLFALMFHPDANPVIQRTESESWARRHAAPLKRTRLASGDARGSRRKLRIGYVSSEFRDHVESHVTIPLLAHHDRDTFEVYCYSGVKQPTRETDVLRSCADGWRDIASLSDWEVAQHIAIDQVDILVNLSMHQGQNRTLVFAYQPAPVQVSWLAYPGTTGLDTIQYRFTDRYLDPPGTDLSVYTEHSVFLPDSFWCYDPLTGTPYPSALPATSNGYVTFGCLNKFAKINSRALSLWARILRAVPSSRLLMVAPPGTSRCWVRAKLESLGVDADRISFVFGLSRECYRETYHRIDICLDPSPFCGGITTIDAFWMGVPVVTLLGLTAVGRTGSSIAHNLGLQRLVARDPDQYVTIAIGLANDIKELAAMRRGLRPKLQSSPLMDGRRFAHSVETLYRQIWEHGCGT